MTWTILVAHILFPHLGKLRLRQAQEEPEVTEPLNSRADSLPVNKGFRSWAGTAGLRGPALSAREVGSQALHGFQGFKAYSYLGASPGAWRPPTSPLRAPGLSESSFMLIQLF